MPKPRMMIEHDGETKSLNDWAAELGLSVSGLRNKLKRQTMGEIMAEFGRGDPPKQAAKRTPARKPASSLKAQVRETAAAIGAATLLRSLGWVVDELGRTPSGAQLLAVHEEG